MKYSTVTQSNAGLSIAHERLVVTGGTQGIGEGVAYRFANAGAEVWIVGRNEVKGNAVVAKLNEISKERNMDTPPQHHFLKADLSLISEAKRVAEAIRIRAGPQGVDYLVMTQGGPPNGKFTPTSESHDRNYAVQVLSRFTLAHKLASDPATSTIKKAVMSIMGPGYNGVAVDYNDLEMLKAKEQGNYGILASVARNSSVADVFTKELAGRNPSVNFTHIFPGFVKTDVFRNSDAPWYISLLGSMFMTLTGISAESYAELTFYLLVNSDGRALAAKEMFTNEKLAKMEPHPSAKDEELRRKIWNHLLDMLGEK